MEYSDDWKRGRLLGGEVLHFPDGLTDEQRTVHPEWILEAIQHSLPVDVENAVISDALNLTSLLVSQPLAVRNSQVPGINTSYATFAQVVHFDGTRFEGDANLHATHFERDLWLAGTHFSRTVDLSDVSVDVELNATGGVFHEELDAEGVRVGHSTDFGAVTFEGEARFHGLRVGGMASFTGATFKAKAGFDGMRVAGDCFCRRATFEGEARFLGVQVEGTAAFSGATFKAKAAFDRMRVTEALFCNPATFEGEARFLGVQVEGSADFTDATFKLKASFDGMRVAGNLFCNPATFEGEARFLGVQVEGSAAFTNATFKANASFENMRVAGNLFCNPATFEGEARFLGVQVKGTADFSGATFEGEARFPYTQVEGPATFVGATFGKTAVFSNARFAGPVFMRAKAFKGVLQLDGTVLNQGLYIQRANFEGDVNFRAATIKLEGLFVGCTFRGKADFSGCVVEGDFDCRSTSFENAWDLRGARLTTFQVDAGLGHTAPNGLKEKSQQSSATVDLRGCTYERIQVYWRPFLERQDPFDRQPYTQFERTMRRIGRDDLADGAYYRRRQREGNTVRPWQLRPWTAGFWGNLLRAAGDRFLRSVAGYGVRPWRMLFFVFFFPVLAWLVFSFVLGAARPASIETAKYQCQESPTWQDAAWLSVRTYFPVEVPAPGGWQPSDCPLVIQVRGHRVIVPLRAASFAGLVKLAGWLFIPTAAATFTGLLRNVGSSRD